MVFTMMSLSGHRGLGAGILATLLVLAALAVGCTSQSDEPRTADDVAGETSTGAGVAEVAESPPEYIGTATMDEDRVITLRLRAEGPGGAVGHGMLTYAPDHAEYQRILEHLGGMEPGDERPVRPFPNDGPSE